MYTIEFYEDSRGNSSVWQFLETLRIKALTNKDARIQMHAFNTSKYAYT